jgi:hypothetical protein
MRSASHIFQWVRDFLLSLPKRIISKEFLIFLFFLALSATFWLLMSLNGTYEEEYPVELRLTGVPRNAVITGPLQDTVYVTIRDKGFQLLAYSTTKKIQPVSVSFSDYAEKDMGHGSVPSGDVKAAIYVQLFKSSRITQLKPGTLDFYFNFGLSKVVPVRMSGRVVPGESYYLSKVEFWPEKVTIYANRPFAGSGQFREHGEFVYNQFYGYGLSYGVLEKYQRGQDCARQGADCLVPRYFD